MNMLFRPHFNHGGEVDLQDRSGRTALMLAVQNQHTSDARVLIAAHADPRIRGGEGSRYENRHTYRTPLEEAQYDVKYRGRHGFQEIIQYCSPRM